MSERPLANKLAIVTGGSRGIGATIANTIAAKGAYVLIVHGSPPSADIAALCGGISKEHGVIVKSVRGDLSRPEEACPAIVAAAKALHEEATATAAASAIKARDFQIDIIVNNAGTGSSVAMGKIQAAQFYKEYALNVLAPILLVQECMPYLPCDASGRIISVSSTNAALSPDTMCTYSGSKAALEASSRTWARELKDRATANCVNPGPVKTELLAHAPTDYLDAQQPFVDAAPGMNALGRGGEGATTQEVADVIGMLCHKESQWINGSVVSCNGGMVM